MSVSHVSTSLISNRDVYGSSSSPTHAHALDMLSRVVLALTGGHHRNVSHILSLVIQTEPFSAASSTCQKATATYPSVDPNNVSAGIDDILNMFLKHCPTDMYRAITQLFNLARDTGIVPTDWCIGLICPTYNNKRQRNDPDNYSGITLLSCIGKQFTSCLNQRLCSYTYIECQQRLGNE